MPGNRDFPVNTFGEWLGYLTEATPPVCNAGRSADVLPPRENGGRDARAPERRQSNCGVPVLDSKPCYDTLIRPLEDQMLRSIWRITRVAEDAEDALQESLAIIWKRRARIERHPCPRAIILRICVHCACDVLRARLRRGSRETAAIDPDAFHARDGAVGERLHRQELRDDIFHALVRLPSRQATAVVMRHVLEMSYEEIGDALGCRSDRPGACQSGVQETEPVVGPFGPFALYGGHKMNTTEENDDVRRTLRQAMPDDLPAAVADRMQSRLAAFRDRMDARSEERRNYFSQWIGGFTMRQRIAVLGGVGAAAMLGFFLLWGGLAAKPASAMEKMAEAVRKATSYECTETIKTTYDFPKPGRPTVAVAVYTIYRQLPGAVRSDETSSYHSWKGTEKTEIFPVGQPSIYIWHPTKTFRRYPPLRKGPYSSTFDRLEDLGQFSSQADRQLGTKEINGKQADGFEINMKKMHPDARGSVAEIWLDRATNLPLFVRYQFRSLDNSTVCEDSDIQWNIDLDPKLFDPTPPEGYTDDTPKPPSLEDQVRDIVAAMKIYAQASGGCYPAKRRSHARHDRRSLPTAWC